MPHAPCRIGPWRRPRLRSNPIGPPGSPGLDVRLTTCSGKNIVTKSKETMAGQSEIRRPMKPFKDLGTGSWNVLRKIPGSSGREIREMLQEIGTAGRSFRRRPWLKKGFSANDDDDDNATYKCLKNVYKLPSHKSLILAANFAFVNAVKLRAKWKYTISLFVVFMHSAETNGLKNCVSVEELLPQTTQV